MPKKLTITLDDAVYEGLYRVVGARRISRFIENLVRPHVTEMDLDAGYAALAAAEAADPNYGDWDDDDEDGDAKNESR